MTEKLLVAIAQDLGELKGTVKAIHATVAKIGEKCDSCDPKDLSEGVKDFRQWKYKMMGGCAAISLLVTVLWGVL